MILQPSDIKTILTENPSRSLLTQAVEYSKDMRVHLYGENLEARLTVIDGFEDKALQKLRVKYAKSNKDLFARLSRPLDKVFSARGGSTYYNLAESAEKAAMNIAANVRDGYSCKKWVEMFWKPRFLDDPNGVIFMEIDQENRCYPTYKASSAIFAYKPKGTMLDYIVFTVSAAEKRAAGIDEKETIYRVVDDAFDYWYKVEGKEVTQVPDHTYPNYFGQVPAIINSDMVSSKGPDQFISLFDEIIDLANQFLTKGSIKVTHDFMHGFPKYWEYADSCNTCNGTGFVESKPCEKCKGSGKSVMTKVSDVKLIEYPDSKEAPIVTPNVAGYVEPSKTYYEIATDDLEALEDAMTFTIWGTHRKQQMGNNDQSQPITATQAFLDVQPVHDRLTMIAEMAERRHKFIIDMLIKHTISQTYSGATINYGRRFLIEGPDTIWNRYVRARKDGAPAKVLNDLLVEYIETKYNGDPINMNVQMKLMVVEPFVHSTVEQVKSFGPDDQDLKAKIYFGEWLSTKSSMEILATDIKKLRDDLYSYANGKKLPTPAGPGVPALN